MRQAARTTWQASEEAEKFFNFFARNPLKRPDPEKLMKINERN
jgi:hypothetical protein